MSVSVLLSGTLKNGLVEQFTEICSEAFHVTRAFDGCQNINLTLNVENPHKYVLTEVWDSKKHYEKYLAFRTEDGTVAAIGDMSVDGPNIDIFDITDA
ncbi:MAG: antibiotic biosynthesis monooxygenase [Gammaproteobacteria bacterium]|nr:antibiotic biosynthesis monooxygenase [Gammaproteobacteria bacterium]